jgi:hypothetical protein
MPSNGTIRKNSTGEEKEEEDEKEEKKDEDTLSRSMSAPPPILPGPKSIGSDVVVSTAPSRSTERRDIVITLLNVQNIEELIKSSKQNIGMVYVTTECGRRQEMTKQVDVNKIDVDRGGVAWNVTFEMMFTNIGSDNPPPQDLYLMLYVLCSLLYLHTAVRISHRNNKTHHTQIRCCKRTTFSHNTIIR